MAGIILPAQNVLAQTDAEAVNQLSGMGQEIVAAINQQRANAGLGALAVNPLLNQAAQTQATDMMVNYNYSHRGSDGSSVKVRVQRTGYAAEPWVSENWVSSGSVDAAMRWWMNDYIHRVNILTPRWQEVGVGVAARPNASEIIFVTVFSAGRGEGSVQASVAPVAQPAAPAPAPAPLPAVEVPPGGMDYTIRAGDTLLGIAMRHRLDWRVVAAANGLGEQSILQIGQNIRLPGVESASAAQFDSDGTTGSTASTEAAESGFSQEAAPSIPTEPYTVKSGDTLFSIAALSGITWQELAALNNFRETDYLQIGQSLVIPARQSPVKLVAESAELAEASEASIATATADQPEAVAASATLDEPFVLESSGMAAGSDANAGFVSATYSAPIPSPGGAPQDNYVIRAQPAAVMGTPPPPPAPASADPAIQAEPAVERVHTVEPGDTIISIAIQHSVDWQELLSFNGLSDQSILQPGQTVRLP